MEFTINGQAQRFDGDGATPLLWVLRDHLGLPGTKFGCGVGQCGACSVHVDGELRRSCITPASTVAGKAVTTIEGLAPAADRLHPVQQAWLDLDVAQCGYCQAGQIMAAANLLARNPDPTAADIDGHMTNICRCGTYVRIRQAVRHAAKLQSEAT